MIKNLEERNAWFNGLTVDQKRVEIAKDVIAQVLGEMYTAATGTYFEVAMDLPVGTNLQVVLEENNPNCSVCAIGAMFTSRVRLGNDYTVNHLSGRISRGDITTTDLRSVGTALDGIFEEEQYRLMEVAFEGDDAVGYFDDKYREDVLDEDGDWEYSTINHDGYHEAVEWNHRSSHNENKRLIAIMENVIQNNGEFIP